MKTMLAQGMMAPSAIMPWELFHVMANTYSKIYLHIIFSTKNRESLIPIAFLPRLHAYMASAIRGMGHFPVAVGGIDNHVHLLVDLSPKQAVSDFIRELKVASTKFINGTRVIPFKFGWQRGYSCFSYSSSHVESVKHYIENQHVHHRGITLEDEIVDIYRKFGVEYDPQYIFDT